MSQDPQLVKDLLALHDKFIDVVNANFSGNSLFQKALKVRSYFMQSISNAPSPPSCLML